MYNKEIIEELLKNNKKVHLIYEKNNGDVRAAVGTRHNEIITESWTPSEKEIKENDNIIKYWDYDKKDWRAFNINKLLMVDILEK